MDTSTEDPDLNIEPKRTLGRLALANITKSEAGQIQYGCRECPATFVTKEIFEQHLCTHFNEYRFICGICGVGLKRREHLERHTQGHLQVRPYSCPECGKAFKRKEHLNIHMSIHIGDKHMKCSLCNKSFYRKDHLQKHLLTHNKSFVKQNMTLTEELDIKQEPMDDYEQIDIQLDIDEQNVKSEMDEGNEEATDPLEGLEPTEERPHQCHVCGKSYKKPSHLKIHSYIHFRNECVECAKVFSSPEELVSHVATAHGDCGSEPANELLVERARPDPRPHQCPVCHKRFKRKQHLKVHSNVHNKQEATIWCSLCNEGFMSNDQFEGHRCEGVGQDYNSENRQHFDPTNTLHNDYPMNIIQESEGMEMEERQLVAEHDIPKPMRVYVCKYCSKPFKRKDHYKIHLNIHTGDKFFFCEDCGKGFYRRDHMQKHAQVHNKPKPAAKPKCKKKIPDLYPIDMVTATMKNDVKPEITIHAPSNTKLRVPLQIKVPYKMVMSLDNGERRAVTVNPTAQHAVAS